MNKILILEDEEMLNEMMREYFTANGYECIGVRSYDEALNLAYEENFDLWVFDVKIIGGSGFELLKNLRESSKTTPCIFTTSLNTLKDLNLGFLSGCDDYLKKPFELAELLLRAKNLIKRNFAHKKEVFEDLGSGYKFNIDKKLLYKSDAVINLTKKELLLLALFLQNKNRVLSRDEIYAAIWEYDEMPSELSLRVYIRNLRKIVGEKIVSKSKIGYLYAG